jgi:hypothetical protein
MSEIAIIGKYPYVDGSRLRSIEELFFATGANTGNLAFALAAHKQIVGDKTYYDWDFDPDVLNAQHGRAVLICANMVNPKLVLTGLTQRIERLKIPFCTFSLGLQAPLYQSKPDLNPTVDRFLRVASAKATSLGVRGRVTGAILNRLGIRNWRIVGCPSNFLNTETNFEGYDWTEAAGRPTGEIGIHVEDVEPFSSYMAQCLKLVGAVPRLFFVQSPLDHVKLIAEAQFGAPPESSTELAWLAHFGARDLSAARALLLEKFRCFFSMEEWIIATSRLRYSFGARLHGNILAIQCGVPSLVVAHDERTRELAQCLGIPYIVLNDFLGLGSSLADVMQTALAVMNNYPARRRTLARTFVAFMHENGLKPSLGLRNIAS